MRKQFFLLLGLMALVALLASCGSDAESAPANLAFEAPMSVDSGQRFRVSLGVRNVGEARFREYTSFGGKTLPNVYDQVFHNQCCEATIHNVEVLGNAVLFHALWKGTWYFVEAGVYEGEASGTYRYTAPEGWSFRYPMHWGQLDEELGFVQDAATGKTVTFASMATTEAELERWLESEIDRKLAATEANNTLAEPLTTSQEEALTIYRYAILSRMEGSETLLRSTVFFDGQRRYEFYAALPPLSEEEYQAVIGSFVPVPGGKKEGG